MRNLVINDETWTYKIGTEFAIIKSPQNKRHNIRLTELTGRDFETIEDGRECGHEWGMVKPSHIKEYIVKNLLNS